MLRAIEGLRTECDLARHECVNAQQRIDLLEGELDGKRDLKVAAEDVFARLATEVGQRQEEVWRLEAEVTRQHDEVRRLRADVNGKSLVFSCCVFSLKFVVSLLTRSVCDLGRSQ